MPSLDPLQPCCEIIEITMPGVQKLLGKKQKHLDPSKASGPNGIRLPVLKEVAKEIARALTLLCHTSLDIGIVPADLRTACVTIPQYSRKGKGTN